MRAGLIAALMLAAGVAGAYEVKCLNGTRWLGNDLNRCPCCEVCDDGSWHVVGEGVCPLTAPEPAPEPLPAVRSESGKGMTVDRIWSKHGFGYALVTVRNSSRKTWPKGAPIECIAFGKDEKKLGTSTRSWFEALPPGFEGTKKLSIALHGPVLEKMECNAKIRR